MVDLEVTVLRVVQVIKATRGREGTVALLGKRVTLDLRDLQVHKDQKEDRVQ